MALAPVVREVAREMAGKCVVVQVNTDDNPVLAGRFNIRGIPHLVLLRKGKVIDSIGGGLEKGALIGWCSRHIE